MIERKRGIHLSIERRSLGSLMSVLAIIRALFPPKKKKKRKKKKENAKQPTVAGHT